MAELLASAEAGIHRVRCRRLESVLAREVASIPRRRPARCWRMRTVATSEPALDRVSGRHPVGDVVPCSAFGRRACCRVTYRAACIPNAWRTHREGRALCVACAHGATLPAKMNASGWNPSLLSAV